MSANKKRARLAMQRHPDREESQGAQGAGLHGGGSVRAGKHGSVQRIEELSRRVTGVADAIQQGCGHKGTHPNDTKDNGNAQADGRGQCTHSEPLAGIKAKDEIAYGIQALSNNRQKPSAKVAHESLLDVEWLLDLLPPVDDDGAHMWLDEPQQQEIESDVGEGHGSGLRDLGGVGQTPVHGVLLQHSLALVVGDVAGDQNGVAFFQVRQQSEVIGAHGIAVKALELAGQKRVDEPSLVAIVVANRFLASVGTGQLQHRSHHLEAAGRLVAQLAAVVSPSYQVIDLGIAPDREVGIKPLRKANGEPGMKPRSTTRPALGFQMREFPVFALQGAEVLDGGRQAQPLIGKLAKFRSGLRCVEPAIVLVGDSVAVIVTCDDTHSRLRFCWLARLPSIQPKNGRGKVFSRDGRQHTVFDAAREVRRPLVHRLVRHAYSFGGSGDGAPKKFNGFGFKHAPLNHSSPSTSTIVHAFAPRITNHG